MDPMGDPGGHFFHPERPQPGVGSLVRSLKPTKNHQLKKVFFWSPLCKTHSIPCMICLPTNLLDFY